MIRLAVGICILWGCGQVADAHPLHVSVAEAEFNGRTGKLEVALRVHPADLQTALEERTGGTVDLEATDRVDQLITGLLQESVVIRREGSQPLRMTWVDKEIGATFAWLFFEFPCDNAAGEWTIENRLFHEQLDDQVNMITFRQLSGKRSLSFTRNRSLRKLRLPLATGPKTSAWRSAAPTLIPSPAASAAPQLGAANKPVVGIARQKGLATPIMSH